MSLAGRSIVVVTERFPNLVQPYVLNHLISLKEAGARLSIVSSPLGNGIQAHPQVATHGLQEHVRYIGVDDRASLALQLASYCRPDYSLGRTLGAARRIFMAQDWRRHGLKYFVKELAKLKLMSDAPFDLLHSHYLGGSYEYLFLREVFGVPLVTTFHGLPPVGVAQLGRAKMAKVFRSGDLFLTNTDFSKRQLRSLGCPENKLRIHPVGLNLDSFPFRERNCSSGGPIVLLSVARLSPEKGLDYAVRAVAKLIQGGCLKSVEYRIVGEGPEAANLTALAKGLGFAAHVKLLGGATSAEVVAHYHAAHLLLAPSLEETQGVVIQEAQATGLPVIATRTGGIPECVIDGQTGTLVEERNLEALAQAIEHLISNYDKARRLARAGRSYVEANFDRNKTSRRLFDLYQALFAPVPYDSAKK